MLTHEEAHKASNVTAGIVFMGGSIRAMANTVFQ